MIRVQISKSTKLFVVITTMLAFVVFVVPSSRAFSSLSQVDQSNGSFDSGAVEWSGATYNADRNVLVAVDDEDTVYEFKLDSTGRIDRSSAVRKITMAFGIKDFEGVAWIDEDRYAVLSEDTGRVYYMDLLPGVSRIDASGIIKTVFAGGPDGNDGSEGLAIAGNDMYVVYEKPSALNKFDLQGNHISQILLTDIADATGVVVALDGSLLVTSHESRKIVQYEVDWDAGTATNIDEISLSAFVQAEGVALKANSDLHIFGEAKGGQTYSHLSGTVVEHQPAVPADINCSNTVDLLDALVIAKLELGNQSAGETCGSGDTNSDGKADRADVIMIVECAVGTVNDLCPSS